MKKILYSILLALFAFFPIGVLAEGYVSVSPSSLTIEQGSTKTFTITAYNAIGDVSISSNNSSIASVSTGEWGTGMVDEKETKTGTITVTGNSVGTTTITLVIDAATFDGDDLAGQTKTITVNVVAKPTIEPQPSNPNNNKPQNNLSKNNNIKILSVEGYELIKVDNNNYTLTVTTDVTSVNINATAEDTKAKVAGTGIRELQVGENNIEVIVTSESGAQNKINIKITRKEGYYLEDLDLVLNNPELQDADIIINADSKITEEEITKIKDSKKTIRLNYHDENKKIVYSWTLAGKEIKAAKEFSTTITYTTENLKEIYKLSNYADGLYINFNHSGDLPTGTKVKLYVGEKFENGNILNVYHYNNSKKTLDFIKDNLEVTDGYIEFGIEHCSEYFVTMSNIGVISKEESSPVNIFMIIAIIELIVIIALVGFIFIKLKPNKKEISNIEIPKTLENNNNNVNTFNEIESNQDLNTINNISTFDKIESNQENSTSNNINNYSDNNMNEFQNLSNTNIDSSRDNNNLYQ